jgi:hypothetical protein
MRRVRRARPFFMRGPRRSSRIEASRLIGFRHQSWNGFIDGVLLDMNHAVWAFCGLNAVGLARAARDI